MNIDELIKEFHEANDYKKTLLIREKMIDYYNKTPLGKEKEQLNAYLEMLEMMKNGYEVLEELD